MGILCDVPVHELTAGDKQLLQPSRNWPMHQAGAYAHLRCGLRLESGRRYLLLGRNGVGKSTLLQAIADGSLPDWPERITTYLVAQGSPFRPEKPPWMRSRVGRAPSVAPRRGETTRGGRGGRRG